MSAIRTNSNRSAARKQRGPYARGVFGTVIRFFGFGPRDDGEDDPETNGNATNATDLQSNAQQNGVPKSPFSTGNRSPLTPIKSGNAFTRVAPDQSSSSIPDAELVANFFSQRMGTNVTPTQVESMISGLQTTPETQKFRFTFTSPARDTSPSLSPPNINHTSSPNATPSRKKLTRNPNGVYRWEGAGSAKQSRPRNRYASPAFGASPTKSERLIIKETKGPSESTAQDNKRRKVGNDDSAAALPSGSSSSNPPIPFPITASPTTPRTNGNTAKPAPLPSSRLRTPAKPTAPVVPSPLRQAWSDGSSNSSREDIRKSPSQSSKQTKTANFMAELIKETTPPSKPDLSNPYQTASPVGKVGPPRRSARRPRATGRPAVPTKEQQAEEEKKKGEDEKKKEQEKLKEYSPQAIIEATVPKGSKRSRPPAHFETKPSDANSSRLSPPPQAPAASETKQISYVVEEVDEEDEESKRSSKRSKPSAFGLGLPSGMKRPSPQPTADITIEEVDDVEMQPSEKEKAKEKATDPSKLTIPTNGAAAPGPSPTLTSRSSFSGPKSNSIPKEPSKLRYSFQAENSPIPPLATASAAHALPTPPTPSPLTIGAVSSGYTFTFKPTSPPTNGVTTAVGPKDVPQDAKTPLTDEEAKIRVRAMDSKSLPVFVLTASGTTVHSMSPAHVRARDAVKVVPSSTLPKFDFSSSESFSFAPSSLPAKLSVSTFNPVASTSASHTTASSSTGPAPVKGFDFAAAGMKAPAAKKDTWDCGLCGLSNPVSAAQCTTCEEPAPAGISVPKAPTAAPSLSLPTPPVQGFNFAAAGLKAPSAPKDTWNCSLCGLSNPKAAPKCDTCEEPAPVDASAPKPPPVAAPPSFSLPTPPVQGFNFAAAGMKAPSTPKDAWSCSLCGLSNPKTAAKCTTCDEPAPAGAATPSSGTSNSGLKMPAPPASFGGFGSFGMPTPPAP